jgi:hypothetical protein
MIRTQSFDPSENYYSLSGKYWETEVDKSRESPIKKITASIGSRRETYDGCPCSSYDGDPFHTCKILDSIH